MPQSQRLIFVSGLGARYTEAGTNMHVIAMKAWSFKKTLQKYQKHDPESPTPFKPRPPKSIKNKIRDEDTDAIQAWEAVATIFTDPNQLRLLKALIATDINLMHASEKEARDFAVDYIAQRNYKKLKSIKKLISALRTFFRNIGREHSWADRTDISWNLDTIGLSGNPITRATQDALIKEAQRRLKRTTPNATNRQINQALAPDKLSAPISAPAAIILIVHFIADLYTKVKAYKPSKDSRRIVNLANMTALYTILLHEACRPGDIASHMTLADIYFPLHTNVPILALAILPPTILAHIITSNLITHFVIASYKGKQARLTLPRLKTLVPYPHNAFDLPTLIIFTIKAILFTAKTLSNPPTNTNKATHLFKANLNISSLRHRKTTAKNNPAAAFSDLTFYSFRYGAAEEDQKYAINESWTRRRMGHSEISNTKDQYAANKKQRVSYNDSILPIAPDIYPRHPTAPTIPLEMIPVAESGITHDPNWLFKLEDAAHQDALTTAIQIANDYINDPSQTTLDALTAHFQASHTTPEDILPPVGFELTFKPNMTTPDIMTLYDIAKEILTKPDTPTSSNDIPYRIPEIWSMPQILYGNFQKLLEGSIDTPVEDDPPRDNTPEPSSIEECEEQEQDTDNDSDSDSGLSWDDGFKLNQIEPSNHIVIYCAKPDKTALKIDISEATPPQTHYIWLAKCVNIQIKPNTDNKQAKLTAYLYFNKDKDPTKPLTLQNKKETIVIEERSVIDVYTDTSVSTLDPENIKQIKTFLLEHW